MKRSPAMLICAVVLAACSSTATRISTATTMPVTSTGARSVSSATTTTTAPTTITTASTTTTTSTTASTTTTSASSPTEPPSPYLPARTITELLALGRPIVLAHTGGEDQFPGSTMYAYGESVKAGVDVLDLNVQLTSDGVLVVQHDDTVDRTSNGHGAVGDLTYAEITALDNAYWFTAACTCTAQPDAAYIDRGIRTGAVPPPAGYTAADFGVPRLIDVIARFPDLPLNIEVKGNGPPAAAAARELVAELRDAGRANAAVVTSFDDAVVDVLRAAGPEIERSPGLKVSSDWVLGGLPLPPDERILQLPPVYGGLSVITPDLIAKAHAAGYVIWVWPNDRRLENPHSYRRLLDEGLDGLNINFPADGVAAVQAFTAEPGAG